MLDKIFASSTAKVLDIFLGEQDRDYTVKEISIYSGLSKPTARRSLETLEIYEFIGKTDKNRYFLCANELTASYVLADYLFKKRNKKALGIPLEDEVEFPNKR